MGTSDAALQHATAPHGNVVCRSHVVNRNGLAKTPDPTDLDVDNAA